MAAQSRYVWHLTLPNQPKRDALHAVLSYEAGMRGLTVGQTLVKLVVESADLDEYPEEVRAAISRLDEQRRAWPQVPYEALARDVSKGLACYELVMEAIGLESYPGELRERLADIEEELSAYSLARAIKKLDRGNGGAREPSPGARKGAANG